MRISICAMLVLSWSAWASTDHLTGHTWIMQRSTGVGLVETIWNFRADGTGKARLVIKKRGKTSVYNHRFEYSVAGEKIFIQDEIDEQWKGHFGNSTWTFRDNEIIGDVKFREEVLIFRHE